MVCMKANGTKMTAQQAMDAGCPFKIDEIKQPYGASLAHVTHNGTRRNRRSRKNRKNTRRNRKNTMRRNRRNTRR